jgi:hypothetical protein
MPFRRLRVALIAFLAVLNVGAMAFLVFVWYPHWHQKVVARAMTASEPPAFWWPPSWRRDLRTSFLLEGSTLLKDPMKRFGDGVVELETEADGRVFRTTIIPGSKGRFSFGDQLFPVGPFRVRLVAPDGRRSRWIRIPEIDPGRHNMNWGFRPEAPSPSEPPG